MNLHQLESPAVYKFIGYLEAVSDFIQTGELRWYFDVKLFEFEGNGSGIESMVKLAYPESVPESAEIKEGSLIDLVETFKHEFGRWLDPTRGLSILTPVTEWQGKMWLYLDECLQLEGARVFEYYTSNALDDFGSGGIVGNFAVVILNENQKRCLFLSAGDCD